MDTGGMNTARPRDDLMNNNAENDHVNVIAATGGGDFQDHARQACNASRTTRTIDNTSSTVHSPFRARELRRTAHDDDDEYDHDAYRSY